MKVRPARHIAKWGKLARKEVNRKLSLNHFFNDSTDALSTNFALPAYSPGRPEKKFTKTTKVERRIFSFWKIEQDHQLSLFGVAHTSFKSQILYWRGVGDPIKTRLGKGGYSILGISRPLKGESRKQYQLSGMPIIISKATFWKKKFIHHPL